MSGRPLHVVLGDDEGFEWLKEVRAEGLPVLAQQGSVPTDAEFKLSEYNLFDYMPNWVQPLVGSREERIAKLSEDGVRVGMKRDVEERPNARTDWARVIVVEVAQDRNTKYAGMTIAEIAEADGNIPWTRSWIWHWMKTWKPSSAIRRLPKGRGQGRPDPEPVHPRLGL